VPVVVVGLHERDAPLELLERVAVADHELPKHLQLLLDSPEISETIIVSTCLRTEVYAVLERFHEGLSDLTTFFYRRLGVAVGSTTALENELFVAYDDAAARHLFAVAAGLDSAVLGEGEILRQVRAAADHARDERASGPILDGLFRHAVEVGKRARTETGIARGTTSLAHVAVELATEQVGGSLAAQRVVVAGAGEMGAGVASALAASAGSPEVVIVNRTGARAATIAARTDARPVALSALAAELAEADIFISATAADEPLLDRRAAVELLSDRGGRRLVIVDVAMPRDIDPGVAELDGISLFDVDDLRRHAEAEMAARRGEVGHVEAIIEEELERYRQQVRSRSVAPLVTALRERADALVAAELARTGTQLEPAERAAVEEATRRVVAKLLHEPTVQLKLAAGSAKGERLSEALRTLFDL
jgi:glutamyl-tRNA reductase